MKATLKARLKWVKLYEETGDAGYVCRRCGISRPTLRKWAKRYQLKGISGLVDQSKKPHLSPNKKVDSQIVQWVTELRNERNLGARRIQSELFRQYQCSLSLSTIHKILVGQQAKPIKKLRRKKKFNRYQRPVPGELAYLSFCKLDLRR